VGFSLVVSESFWFILLCLLAGAGYAAVLYFREKSGDFSRRTAIILAVLRGLAVALIAFLLLSPLLRTSKRYTEKPIVIFALDNSASMVSGKDSAQVRNEFLPAWNDLISQLSSRYEIRQYTFGDAVRTDQKADFNGKQTDMAGLFSELRDRYSNRNLAALVMASDGISNQGADPLYASDDAPYSIYTVALGDTNRYRDLLIPRVSYNRIAFLGNDFPVEITVAGYKCNGLSSEIRITTGENQVFSQSLSVSRDPQIQTVTARLTAAHSGIQKYRTALKPVAGESNTANNFQDIYVEVLDSRQKILILESAPHPDIAALRQAIEKNRNYEVEEHLLSDFNGSVASYSLVILHQIPSKMDGGQQVINQLKNLPVPVLFILGNQSDLNAYNNLAAGLVIPPSGGSFNEATALLNPDFSLFSLGKEVEEMLPAFPPLRVPFSQYKPGVGSQPLLYQKIGSVTTRIPMILFNPGNDRKSATITGEGLWRWRLANYARSGNQLAFDELMGRMVQYLALKEDKSRFRILHKSSFPENESVQFDAELYNESYQLLNEPEVSMVITDEHKKNFTYTLSRSSNAYYLNAGTLPPGEYSYSASTAFAGKTFSKTGRFTVAAINIESVNTLADHRLLNTLASRHKGKMLYPASVAEIAKLLEARDDLKTIAYSRKRYTDLVGFLPVLILLLGLLSAEWFIRKRNGSY
jgi:hypothetical protein